MYDIPKELNSKFLGLWVRYMLRHCKGNYMVILGKEQYADGPCGACPFEYIEIYKNVGESQEDERVILDGEARYVTVSDSEFRKAAMQLFEVCLYEEVLTNNRKFKGIGFPVTVVQLLEPEEIANYAALERTGALFTSYSGEPMGAWTPSKYVEASSKEERYFISNTILSKETCMNNFCTQCGRKFSKDARFCGQCGGERSRLEM